MSRSVDSSKTPSKLFEKAMINPAIAENISIINNLAKIALFLHPNLKLSINSVDAETLSSSITLTIEGTANNKYHAKYTINRAIASGHTSKNARNSPVSSLPATDKIIPKNNIVIHITGRNITKEIIAITNPAPIILPNLFKFSENEICRIDLGSLFSSAAFVFSYEYRVTTTAYIATDTRSRSIPSTLNNPISVLMDSFITWFVYDFPIPNPSVSREENKGNKNCASTYSRDTTINGINLLDQPSVLK